MNKRLVGILLVLCMALTLFPATVSAAPATSVFVGSVELPDGKYLANGSLVPSDEKPAGGYAYFHDGTLTLHDANITGMHEDAGYSYGIYGNGDLNIVLENDNTISGTDWLSSESSNGIFAQNLTISGDGKLEIETGPVSLSDSFGIIAFGITISDDANVIVHCTSAPKTSIGIYCLGILELKDSAMLEAYAGDVQGENSIGVYAGGSLNVSGGTLKAVSGTALHAEGDLCGSFGIACMTGSVTISGGTVTAVGNDSNLSSVGFFTGSDFTITGGSVTARTTKDAADSAAITSSPDLSGYANYQWRTAQTDAFSVPPFVWALTQKYIEITPQSVPHAVTISGGGTGASGAGSYNKDAIVNINAGTRSDSTFAGWSGAGVTFANASAVSTSFTMPDSDVTVTANWSYNGGNTGTYTPTDTTVYNSYSQVQATVWLTGSGLSSGDLLVTETLASGDDYNYMLGLTDQGDIFRVYHITLQSGKKALNGVRITFALSDTYAGQTFTLVHKKADGTRETFTAQANAKGEVTFGPLYEMSPFMLVKGTLVQANSDAAADIPQTGDNSAPGNCIAITLIGLLLLAVSLVVSLRSRKSKKDIQ